jgi:hypothetical protein
MIVLSAFHINFTFNLPHRTHLIWLAISLLPSPFSLLPSPMRGQLKTPSWQSHIKIQNPSGQSTHALLTLRLRTRIKIVFFYFKYDCIFLYFNNIF